MLAELKEDPGPLGLETLLREVGKLQRARALGLPPELFADASEKLVAAWRARAARMYPSELHRVRGKEEILFSLAEAALDHPDDTVRAALYPVVPGGEQTLKDLVREAKANQRVFQPTIQRWPCTPIP